ncbi:hypothetical protein Q7P37_004882 [Cladosporium fusiforme]
MYVSKTRILAFWSTISTAASIPYPSSPSFARQDYGPSAGTLYFPVDDATLKVGRVGEHYWAAVGGLVIGQGNETARFEKVSGAEWISIGSNGSVSGTPEDSSEGIAVVEVRATDDAAAKATIRLSIPVRGADEPLLQQLGVMSYNLWAGGSNVNNYHEKQLRFILGSGADVIGLQESVSGGHAQRLSKALGWRIWQTNQSAAIISRYPIVKEYGQVSVSGGVRINLNGESGDKKEINFWNSHLTAYPYGPYGFCFDNDTKEAVLETEAESGRTPQMAELLETMSTQLAHADSTPVLLTGDMNAPSHLDWVEELRNKHCGIAEFGWPTSVLPEGAGLIDSYRVAHPDPAEEEGVTWSPLFPFNEGTTGDPEPQDRIDFVYATEQLQVLSSETVVVGDPAPYPEHEDNEWTSDHKAVLTWFQLP